MKIENLAIIFLLIIVPISLLLSEYTQFQVQTINLQTEYDAKLTSATYDAIRAFQLNSANESTSSVENSKLRDLEASIASFKNSIKSAFELYGYSEEDLNSYIPALVYTLYDGLYIYSPYENISDEDGNIINNTANREKLYGLKPYITYSNRYTRPNIDVVITYSLENFITVQGMINGEYVNKSGYLIDGIEITINDDLTIEDTKDYTIRYNGIEIQGEQLKEYLPIQGTSQLYPYTKVNGIKYYYHAGANKIFSILNGTIYYYDADRNPLLLDAITNENKAAKEYYKHAKAFSDWFKNSGLAELEYDDGEFTTPQLQGDTSRKIFRFNTSADPSRNIENELSSFNQHRLAVIRHQIESNLAIAISNYNNYSGVANVFQMPELKETDWDHITHNISLISFLQGLPIGGKIYNGYTIVTNSESKEVVTEQNIYLLGVDSTGIGSYGKVGDHGFETGDLTITSLDYDGYNGSNSLENARSAGRLNLDFERSSITSNYNKYYYYPMKAFNASYNSIVMQQEVTTYDDIYEYVNGQSDNIKLAFYTALGRERYCKYNYYNSDDLLNVNTGVNLCTVMYDYNDGVNSPTGKIQTRGAQYEFIQQPTRPGYEFKGWWTSPTGGTEVKSTDICNGDITLYAHWQ